ncbi:MAG TPA: hypothetical protein VMR86_07760 [Myxococcota bacterium]|nr:hypothetical protein [Myxococcota bacterium]
MKRIALLAGLALLSLVTARARAADTSSDIAAETARTIEEGAHVANFWWLPPEYWIRTANELSIPDEERAKVARIFRDYVIVGALDADLSEKKKPAMASIADVVKRARFSRDGQTLEVLHEVNPDVSKLVPTLVYLLRNSLGPLGDGLRLLPLANVDPKGNPYLTAGTRGELVLQYRFKEDGPAHDIRWHAPLTSVAGVRKCPKGGEPLEASWTYCPWHGVKLPDLPEQKP